MLQLIHEAFACFVSLCKLNYKLRLHLLPRTGFIFNIFTLIPNQPLQIPVLKIQHGLISGFEKRACLL
jgi:hypothetical protein